MNAIMTDNRCYVGVNTKLGDNVKIGYGAYIEDGSTIGNEVTIGHHTIVYADSVINDNTLIEPLCVIGHPTKMQTQRWDFSASSTKVRDLLIEDPVTIVGKGSIIRSGSTIYKHVISGSNLKTGHNVVIREHTTLGDDLIVGTQTTLDGYVRAGNKSMIESHCYVTQASRIGSGVFIAPGCVFLDNKRIILGEGLDGPTVEDFVRIGGGTEVLPGVKIGKYSLIGAGSLVAQTVPERSFALGVPAKVQRILDDEEIRLFVNSIMQWK